LDVIVDLGESEVEWRRSGEESHDDNIRALVARPGRLLHFYFSFILALCILGRRDIDDPTAYVH
jgi:hypothetical protein